MSASHTMAQRLQAVPFDVSRHFASSITGLNVRLKRPIRFMRPAMGQKRVHHLRRKTSSMISINGMRTTATVMSALANRRQNTNTVAKVRPMGHTRQNTGKPKMAVDSSAPPST